MYVIVFICSTSLFSRCIPNVAEKKAEGIFKDIGVKDFFEQVVSDISSSWKEIIYMCLVAVGLSIVVTILFRFLAGIIVYLIIALVALSAILAIIVTWLLWYFKDKDYKSKTNANVTENALDDALGEVQAEKLLKDEWTQANSAEEVRNFMIVAIVTSIVGVSNTVVEIYRPGQAI